MKRALSVVAAAIALWPSIALAADVSDLESLRAILPDALDSTYVETVQGQSGFLEGPLTYDSITAYYTYYKQSASFIDTALNLLRDNKYQGGYARSWFRPRTQDQLSETVRVFATSTYARSYVAAAKADDHANLSGSYFDPGLGPDAYGELDGQNGYYGATVVFVKGNAVYSVAAGSTNGLKPEEIQPQSQKLFGAAPANVGLPAPPQSPIVRFRLPLLITFVSGTVLIAVALVIAAVSALKVRPVQPAPRHA